MPKKVIKQISKIYFDKLDSEGQEIFNALYDEYEKQPIFTLREVARDMGLRSATTMQKGSLIEKMVQTRLNNTLLRAGADSKKALNAAETDESLIDDYLQKTVVKNPVQVDGTVYLSNSGACIRRCFAAEKDDIYLPMRIVNDYYLSTGDYITGKARALLHGGQGLYAVETLNGSPAKKGVEPQIIKPVFHALEIAFKLDGTPQLEAMSCLCPFYYGGRRLIISRGVQSLTDLTSRIIVSFDKQGARTAALFLDEQEDTERLKKLPGRIQPLTVEDMEKADGAALLACEYVKKAAAAGQAAVLLVNNADILDEKTLRRLFSMPRFINDGSIKVILLSAALELDQKINRLTRLADSVVELGVCGGIKTVKRVEK